MRWFPALALAGLILGTALAVPVDTRYLFVDLQPQANQKLTDNFGSGADGNNLASLPRGEQKFDGVRFLVGEKLIQLGSRNLANHPERVSDIKIGKTFAKLHILHATQYGGGPNKEGTAWFVKDDTAIGEYRVRYEDKSMQVIPIVYGKDVRDWYFVDGEKDVSRSKVVWEGDNENAKLVGSRLRLYRSTWENPKPDVKVIAIDYVAKKGETVAAPFCVAMTLEKK